MINNVLYADTPLADYLKDTVPLEQFGKENFHKYDKLAHKLPTHKNRVPKPKNSSKSQSNKHINAFTSNIVNLFLFVKIEMALYLRILVESLIVLLSLSLLRFGFILVKVSANTFTVISFVRTLTNLVLSLRSSISMIQEFELVMRETRSSSLSRTSLSLSNIYNSRPTKVLVLKKTSKLASMKTISFLLTLIDLLPESNLLDLDIIGIKSRVSALEASESDISISDLKTLISIVVDLGLYFDANIKSLLGSHVYNNREQMVCSKTLFFEKKIAQINSNLINEMKKNLDFGFSSSVFKNDYVSTATTPHPLYTLGRIVQTLNTKLRLISDSLEKTGYETESDLFSAISNDDQVNYYFDSIKEEVDLLHSTYNKYAEMLKSRTEKASGKLERQKNYNPALDIQLNKNDISSNIGSRPGSGDKEFMDNLRGPQGELQIFQGNGSKQVGFGTNIKGRENNFGKEKEKRARKNQNRSTRKR
ncbi:hypothetical protein BB560_002448 [Smittium megazygosporum]|uniref:Uncharacterized protein n=1 Tax=Smittium megazygosporum TaxID=133381 RepID=A0A2T9ZER3_9FUNG|nr:hypothetical protein BB560_002448 [Smittium megazygosporum]